MLFRSKGPSSKGYRTPPLLKAVPQNLKKSHHPAKNSPAERAKAMEDQVKALVSGVISNAIARNERPIREAMLSPLDRGPRSKARKTSPLLTAVPKNLKKSQHSSKKSPAAPAKDIEDPVKAFISRGISSAIACNEESMREARLFALGRGPSSKGYRTPPLLRAVPDRKSTRLNSSHRSLSRMPSSA